VCAANRPLSVRRVTVSVSIVQEQLADATKDHVFPGSWYPDTTPDAVRRWTAPSCERCNGYFGHLEKELLVFFACCIDPTKPAAHAFGLFSLSSSIRGRLFSIMPGKILDEQSP
jgi:hypothetical protein